MATAPWLDHYDPGVPRTLLPYPDRTLLDYVREAAERGPERTAVLFRGAALSNARLERESDSLAAALVARGLRKGDRVALVLPNSPQFVIAELGIWKAGGVVAPLNPIYTGHELEEAMAQSRPRLAIVLTRFYERVKALQPRSSLETVVATSIKEYLPPVLRVLYTLLREKKEGDRIRLQPGDAWLGEIIREHATSPRPAVDVNPDDPALLLMSGGTTGSPKAALGRHRSIVMSGLQLRSWLHPILSEWDDLVMLPLPLFHVYGSAGVQSFALIGHNPLVLPPNPRDMDDLIHTVHRLRPTIFAGVPALFSAMLEHPKVKAGKVDMSSIDGCFSGASPLLAETKRRFESLTGGVIVEGYSLTEAMMACCVNPVLGEKKVGSVGMPMPDMEVRIVDPEDGDRTLPTGEVGELLMRAPQLMDGYWEQPNETAETLRRHGEGGAWLHTGDLATLDDDGYVRIVDRKKDLIKVSGLQVWPREVEEVVAAHPAVADVGCAGIPHPRKGEVVKAWVVLRGGEAATEDEIRDHCRKALAPFKVPRAVEFCDELPRNMMGKVLRRSLRESAAREAGELPPEQVVTAAAWEAGAADAIQPHREM